MSKYYLTRSQAAREAKKVCNNFRTRKNLTHRQFWSFFPVSGPSAGWPEVEKYAKEHDFVAWVETDFKDDGRSPGYEPVLIVSCRLDEISPDELKVIKDSGWKIAPMTPELFGKETNDRPQRREREPSAPRAKSDVESPTKLVWSIADSMPGADRNAVVEACVAKGVNKSTAQTQYYRWAKAKGGAK